jgi:hypothetical protein
VDAAPARSFGTVRAGFVTMAAGVVMVLGTLLPFQRVSANIPDVPSESFSALDLSDGPLYLALGGVIAAFGLVILLVGRGALPRVLGGLAAVAGAVALVAGIIDLMGTGEEGLQVIADAVAGRTPGVDSGQVLQFLRERDVSVTAGIGLFVILAGSLVALTGGVWAALTRRATVVVPPALAPPSPGEPPDEPPATEGDEPTDPDDEAS